jgi:putative transposase
LPKTITAIKSVSQSNEHTAELLQMMETFRQMVNDCLRIGLANDISAMKKLSNVCYPLLAQYDIVSYYKLNAISKAAGMLASRKKSIRRGYPTKDPCMRKPTLVSSYGFKISDGSLKVPLGNREYFDISLNNFVKGILSDSTLKVRSFTLTVNTLSICYSKDVLEIECTGNVGVDRNLENLTVGNDERVRDTTYQKLSRQQRTRAPLSGRSNAMT